MAMASPHVSNTPMNRCPSGLHASFLSVPQLTPTTVSCQSEGLTVTTSSSHNTSSLFAIYFGCSSRRVRENLVSHPSQHLIRRVRSKKSFNLLNLKQTHKLADVTPQALLDDRCPRRRVRSSFPFPFRVWFHRESMRF